MRACADHSRAVIVYCACVNCLVCFHIRDEIRHGISGRPESLRIAVPRVDPQNPPSGMDSPVLVVR